MTHGYHTRKIEKGNLGMPSKIREEFEEFEDAMKQGNPVMAVHELTDLIGAIEAFVANYNFTLTDLLTMKEATKRAFRDGTRN